MKDVITSHSYRAAHLNDEVLEMEWKGNLDETLIKNTTQLVILVSFPFNLNFKYI